MNSNLFTTQTAQAKSFKDQVKIKLGRVFSILFNQRATELLKQPSSYPSGLKDKVLMAFLKEKSRVSNNTSFFERLHADFWQGQGGVVFSSNCDHRFDNLFLARQAEDLAVLQKYWRKSECKHIVEIGCCSGLHLQHLTTTLSGVESAIGIDINSTQIQANSKNPKFHSRIKFLSTDGGAWLIENAQPNTLFVTNGGVLEYFSREQLDEILSHVSKVLSPAMFFTVEPVAIDHDVTNLEESFPFGEELSFSHNYRNLYESNGFEVLHQRPVDFESWRMTTTIAKTNS